MPRLNDMTIWTERLGHARLRSFTDEDGHFWLEQNADKRSKWARLGLPSFDSSLQRKGKREETIPAVDQSQVIRRRATTDSTTQHGRATHAHVFLGLLGSNPSMRFSAAKTRNKFDQDLCATGTPAFRTSAIQCLRAMA
jgi:hypothetical protein